MHSIYSVVLFTFASTCLSAPTPYGSLKWQACPSAVLTQAGTSPDVNITCGYMQVPMDWDHPESEEKVTLGMAKLPAKDPANRIGYLFYNPGGPGDLASSVLAAIAAGGEVTRIHDEILDRFDIIGIDLRGSGLSDPIICDNHLYNNAPSEFYSSNEDLYAKRQAHNVAFRESCLKLTGSRLIEYMDTVSIVKDHEAVRQALGENSLTWLGQSYGTQLATQYAELFPNNIRAMVLDGCLSISQSPTTGFVWGAESNDEVLKTFFVWCERQNATSCPLKRSKQSIETIWDELTYRSERNPIPAPACQSQPSQCMRTAAYADDIRVTIEPLLYDFAAFPYIATILAEAAFHNNASAFGGIPITDDETPYETWLYSLNAISCQDWGHADSPAHERFKELFASSETPLLNGVSAISRIQQACIGWPAPKRNPPHRIRIPKTPSMAHILMLNNLYDPATPFASAINLQQELGDDRAILLARNATGHTAYLKPDAYDGLALAAVNKYLLTLEVPDEGTVYQN